MAIGGMIYTDWVKKEIDRQIDRERVREREKEKERERETERETDRQRQTGTKKKGGVGWFGRSKATVATWLEIMMR